MTYPETIQYLESFVNYEKIPVYPYKESLKLERIKGFLSILGNPEQGLRFLHVAGTKGKGSTSAFLTYILREAGYRVGLYTSPHLSDFRERIRILTPNSQLPTPNPDFEGMIAPEELADLVQRSKSEIEKYNQGSVYGPLSFFEIYTAMAFIYFKEKKVDFAVLETGLGGRLDATNVVNPLAAVITPISYEHTQKLGNTLREIATEKAGIIKSPNSQLPTPNLIVISAPQEEEAIEVIRNKCQETGARLYEMNKNIIQEKVKGLEIPLIGEHQLMNAACAISAIEALQLYNIKVSPEVIKKGIAHTRWPGRCEVVAHNPTVILDGAQNVASAGVLKKAIRDNFKYKKLILLLGVSSDKDIKGICSQLQDLADEVILTKADNPRATSPKILAGYFSGRQTFVTENIQEAKSKAKELAQKEDLILVTGSLFVVGEYRNV